MDELSRVLLALSALRTPHVCDEYSLHALVAQALQETGISCRHEAPVAPGRRVDFLCGGVAVEVKRGRPSPVPLLRQLSAYAKSGSVEALVLVAERVPPLPAHALRKTAKNDRPKQPLGGSAVTEGWENEYGGEWDGEETVGWLTGGSDEEPQQQPAITDRTAPAGRQPIPCAAHPRFICSTRRTAIISTHAQL